MHSPRHSGVVRATHWIVTVSFFGLLVSGIGILLAHPRLYWGETGALGTPALLDLPIPLVLGDSGWGRSLHFLSAWVCVLSGMVYVPWGLLTRHFRKHWIPASADPARLPLAIRSHFPWSRPAEEELLSYNILQRCAYLVVVFVLFPMIVFSGLAMSPAITSAVPALVNGFGGQQSARTVHFFLASLLVLFVAAHIAMVCRAGVTKRMRAMIMGELDAGRDDR